MKLIRDRGTNTALWLDGELALTCFLSALHYWLGFISVELAWPFILQSLLLNFPK